jgi:Rieske Fe-S protein
MADQPHDNGDARRSFLKRATYALGAVFAFLLGVPGVAYLVDPRNRTVSSGQFKRVARLAELPAPAEGGKPIPKQFVIRDTRRDAWTLHTDFVVGRVWLMRRGNNEVDAFTTICPHLGCSINFQADQERFGCPCHNGAFHLTGERLTQEELGAANPPPRGMDRLEVRLAAIPDSEDAYIEVKYENFVQGLHDRQLRA